MNLLVLSCVNPRGANGYIRERGRKRKGSSDVPGAPWFCASPFLFCARQLCGVRHKGSVEGTESASIIRDLSRSE
jgi:hypothetical protein